MKLLVIATSLAVAVSANYVSQGWKPGQVVSKQPAATTTPGFDPLRGRKVSTPTPTPSGPPESFWAKFFTTGPLGALLQSKGMNVSAAIEKSRLSEDWDLRIPILYDETFGDTVVNETLSAEDEGKRVWFIIISGGPQANAVSQYLDKQFDELYNITLAENDLPNVRFARINYMEVTYITTKWAVWKAPMLVLLTDRGNTLRFYQTSTLNTKAPVMHRFLVQEAWRDTEPWSSPYSPGGKNEYILEFIAVWMAKAYRLFNQLPRFVFLIMTGGLTSVLLSCLHRGESQQQSKPPVKRANLRRVPAVIVDPQTTVPSTPQPDAAPTPPSTHTPKKRKGGKK